MFRSHQMACALALLVVLVSPVHAQAPGETVPPPSETTPSETPPSAPAETPVAPPSEPVAADPAVLPAVPEAAPPVEVLRPRRVQIHGFVSEGGFISTDNNYIGESSRGSLEFFEVGINVSSDIADKLRAGVQLFARDEGVLHDVSPRIDWAFLDYAWRPSLGLRAGVIKMPFGLYNEYVDIDAARVPILLPQSLYSFRTRDVLLSHRGFSLYGTREVGSAGELDYQVWLGSLTIPSNALTIQGGFLERVDTKYVTGAQLFWHPPIEGLRVGATFVRASIDFHLAFEESTRAQLVMLGLVPPDYDGKVVISQRPDTLVVGSTEYTRGDWLFAAEYNRTRTRQRTSLPALIPTYEQTSERFYGMATYQVSPKVAAGAYYSVSYLDVDDRKGHDPKYAERFYAWQRDLAATLRLDVNEHWLWKLEAHFIDGTADLDVALNANPTRYWGLFLARTTVTF